MAGYLVYLFLFSLIDLIGYYECRDTNDLESTGGVEPLRTESDYVYWPFGSVPFYIDSEHFDHEQSLSIMTALSLFSYKTCLKFAPVLARPEDNQHVLVFENPTGARQCQFNTRGHSVDEPHRLVIGYNCIKSPYLEMMVMRALGFPFEHNRAIRNIYIDVQLENVEPAYVELFTKEGHLPMQLRSLPYDINSVMHFGEREFSKNGHRTIIFKDHKVRQTRTGLSPIDIKKIQIVYGPECIMRDRHEKIELCKDFPGAARRKREIDAPDPTQSLRVNRNITPPRNLIVEDPQPHNNSYDIVSKNLTNLGIENEVQLIVDQANKVAALALQNARERYCNKTKPGLRVGVQIKNNNVGGDILGIVESVARYAQSMVEHALQNLTEFCEQSQSLELYQRQRQIECPFYNSPNCPKTYKSTKSGPVRYSTQHRPLIQPSTKHEGSIAKKGQFDSVYRASDDNASVPENATEIISRKKREVLYKDFNPYPLENNFRVRRKRNVAEQDSPVLDDSMPVTTSSSTYQVLNVTENNTRKKRESNINTTDFNIQSLFDDMNVRSKRDAADNTSETETSVTETTTQTSTIEITTEYVSEPEARKKREVDNIDTRDFNAQPLISNMNVRNKREVRDNVNDTEASSSTAESTTPYFITKAAEVKASIAVDKVIADVENDTGNSGPKMGEMDVVIVSTDKTGGYVDAEDVPKDALRTGTTIVRDGNRWAAEDRRSQPIVRRMFRAKYPAEARRRGNFEAMHWEPEGSEGEQRDLEEDKRVMQEDPDLKFVLEGNQGNLFESKKKETEESDEEVPRKKVVEDTETEVTKKKIIEDSEEELPKKKSLLRSEEVPKKKVMEDSEEELPKKKIPLESEEEVPKKKRERGKKRQKELEDFDERKKKMDEDYEERKRKPVGEEERKRKKETKNRDQRLKKLEPKVSGSESNEAPEPKNKVKSPLKIDKDLVSTDEDIPIPKKSKKVIKPVIEPALEQESEVEIEAAKKPTKKIVSSSIIKKEDSEPVRKPAKKKIIEPASEKDDSEEIEVPEKRPIPRTVDLTRKNKNFYKDRKWPDGVVPYIINDDPKYDIDDVRRRLKEVNDILREKTCVQLKEIKPTETNKYEDYLVLDTSPDYVTGRVGGKQNFGVVELFQGGQHRQHAAMMAMAMLGFYFEVSRHDRDQYIRVHPRHVRPDKLHHFEKIRSDATLRLPYDYRSATHPAWQFWRHLGRTGISTVATYKEKDPDGSIMKQLGQNEQLLSDLDLVKINSVYGVECFKTKVGKE